MMAHDFQFHTCRPQEEESFSPEAERACTESNVWFLASGQGAVVWKGKPNELRQSALGRSDRCFSDWICSGFRSRSVSFPNTSGDPKIFERPMQCPAKTESIQKWDGGTGRTSFFLRKPHVAQLFLLPRSMMKSCLVLLALSSALTLTAAEYYVSPNGSSSGDGSQAKPWDLKTAFANNSGKISPGDTVWLRGGTYGSGYSTLFNCNLTGTETAPITVRQYPGEHARVDGGINSNNGWVTFWGFEIMNSSPERLCQNTNRPGGINLYGRGSKAINLVVHDTGHPAIGFWQGVGDGGEINGCIVWNNGLYDLSDPRFPEGWTRGSGTYTQNKDGTRYIKDMIAFRNFTTGINAYTEGTYTDGYYCEGNVVFGHPQWNLWFTGGHTYPEQRLKVVTNFVYLQKNSTTVGGGFGYSSRPEIDVTLLGNYIVSGTGKAVDINRWQDVTMLGNTFISAGQIVGWTLSSAQPGNINNNTYHTTVPIAAFVPGNVPTSFDNWKATTGFDANSTLVPSWPKGIKVVVRNNAYENKRAHIIIYNWDLATTASVDLSGTGLKVGDRFEIRDVQNFLGQPVLSGTYAGGSVTLPLNLTTITPPIGTISHFNANEHTPSDFNCFVLLPTTSTTANTAPTMSAVGAQVTTEDTPTPPIPFQVSDAESSASALTVSGVSDNQALIPNSGIVFSGSGSSRFVSLTPAENQSGTANITLTVNDGSLTASRAFAVTVGAVNDGPTLNNIANQTITAGNNTGALPFTISDPDTAATSLLVSATSSNPGLVPNGNIVLGGSGASRNITVTPAAGQTGTAIITVTVSDGLTTGSRTFTLTVTPPNAAPAVSAGSDQMIALNRTLQLSGTASDDGIPNNTLSVLWSMVSGPGAVVFGNATALATTARFSLEGQYTLQLAASDGQSTSTSTLRVFVVPSDGFGPSITAVTVSSISSTSAVITWTSSQPADTQVQYGTTGAYGLASAKNPQLLTAHTVVLTGLTPGSTYQFRALSEDANGNLAVSGNSTFTTKGLPNVVKVYIPVPVGSGSLTPPMAAFTDTTTQQKYVTSTSAGSGTITCSFYIPEAGDYVIWSRVLAPSYNQDSFYVSVDGGAEDVFDVAENTWSSNWQWTRVNGRNGGDPLTLNPRTFILTPGNHTITFRQRDVGTAVSKLIVTKDTGFVPSDATPVAGSETAATLTNMVIQMTATPGYNMIGNQLTKGNNTLAEILPNVTDGTRIFKYNPSAGNYLNSVFSGGAWSNPGLSFSPGEAMFVYNEKSTAIPLLFTGTLLAGQSLPTAGGMRQICSTVPRAGTFTELFGQPREGDTVYFYDSQAKTYTIHTFDFGVWNQEPFFKVGDGFFFLRAPQ